MGRKTKSDEYNLINKMENTLPTDKVLQEFANIISFGGDERLRLAAIVKWMEWRIGKPKESKESKTELEISVPKITFK
jgi:hypothetical protein